MSNKQNSVSPSAFRPKVIYTAELGLRVDRVDAVQLKLEQVVASYGGYFSEAQPGRLIARLPADKFDPAMHALAALGEVTHRHLRAQDATERVVDLKSRLRSAIVMRDRILELIDRSDNIEHALQAEQHLARVTEQIEVLQGRLRLAEHQIAYATITITIEATPESQRLTPEIPIVWVRELGNVFRERSTIDVMSPRRLRDGVRVDLPEGFIRYFQEGYVTQAVDANGTRIRVRRFKNFDEGPQAFWVQLVARSLRENAGLEIEAPRSIDLARGGEGAVIYGQKKIAGETVAYLIAVASSEDYVYAYEAWGVASSFDQSVQGIEASIRSMRRY